MGVAASIRIRSLARGALAAAVLDLCAHLGSIAGWSGYALGRSTLLLGLASAASIAGLLVRPWNRSLRSWRASLPLSLLALAGFALLPRFPACLHPAGTAWLDATLVLLLPALPLAAAFERRHTAIGLAILGALTALVADERLLFPRLGFGLSILLWAAVWTASEIRAWDLQEAELAGMNGLARLGLLGWSGIVGFAVAWLRPFLSQHVPPERAGDEWMTFALFSMWALGWFAASVVSRNASLRWIAWTSFLLFFFGTWVTWETLSVVTWARWPAWLEPLRDRGSGLSSTLLSTWVFLAFPALCAGIVSRGLRVGGSGACALVFAGFWAGTIAAERLVLPRLDEGGAWESSARARLLHPPVFQPRAYALNPDGASTRYAQHVGDEPVEVTAWRGVPWSRTVGWARLESCEILAPEKTPGPEGRATGLLCIGFSPAVDPIGIVDLDPLPVPGDRSRRGRNPCEFMAWTSLQARDAVLLSHPASSQGLALVETRTALERLARDVGPHGSLWAWCDPRGLRPEGLRTMLSTWRAASPAGQVYVLLDGYGGPLIGLHAAGPEPAFADLKELTLLRVPTRDLQLPGAEIATLDRPLLLWQSESDPSPSSLPSGVVIRTLALALGLASESAAARLLEGLALHAEGQEVRDFAASTYDRVRVPENEIAAYRAALESDPRFEPLIRHLDTVADLLYRKREFDLLLALMREATAVRPDAAAFHRHLGRALRELLDRDGAITEMELAYSLDPGSVEVRTELSKTYTLVRRFRDAIRLLESVWEEKPELEIAKGLGLTYLQVEDYPRARQFLEFVHARSPGDVDVEGALRRLNRADR